MTKSSSPNLNFVKFPINLKWIGLLLLIAVVIIVFTIGRCPTGSQTFSIYLLTAYSFSFLFPKSIDTSTFEYKVAKLAISLAGSTAFFLILLYFNPIDKFIPTNCEFKSVTLAVVVHGKAGKQDFILKNKGKVVIDIDGGRLTSPINENGEAFFPSMHVNDTVQLNIDFSEPYMSLNPDSFYLIPSNGKLYLQVLLKGTDKIEGHIIYHNSPLSGVKIQTKNLYTISDSSGFYLLSIPDSLQKPKYEVWFSKKGFQSQSSIATPETDQPLNIQMTK